MDKNYLVSKSNSLINSQYSLTTIEEKIILTLASMVQPEDIEFKEYKFKIKDFLNLLRITDQSKYKEIPRITKNLMKKVFEIKEKEKIIQLAWLCSAIYENDGMVKLKFAPDLKPYLLKLKEFYTSYRLTNILNLKSRYSIRLYEILKCYQNQSKKKVVNKEIDLEELKGLLGASSNYFSVYADFKKRALLVGQKELKKFTDIYFDFEEVKKIRKVIAIKFTIQENEIIKDNNFDGQIDFEEVTNDNIELLVKEYENNYKGEFHYKNMKILVNEKGFECIKECINEAKHYIKNINQSKFYDFALRYNTQEAYKKLTTSYNNSKPIQATNYEQRQYSDEFFDSLYENFQNEQMEQLKESRLKDEK